MKRDVLLKTTFALVALLLLLSSYTMQAQEAEPYSKERSAIWDKEHYKYTPWTQEQKLFALSKFWAEVKRNFVFMDRVGAERWDSLYQSLIIPAQQTKNDREFKLLMDRFCSFLHDSHTEVFTNRRWQATSNGFDSLKWNTEYVDGKFIVNNVSYPAAKEVPAGSEIIEVNGMPVMDYCRKYVLPRISSSTEAFAMLRAGYMLLEGLWYSKFVVKLRLPDNSLRTKTLYHMWKDYGDKYDELPEIDGLVNWSAFYLGWLEDDIAYIKMSTFSEDSVVTAFERCLPELQKRAKKMIIDIRLNGGGSTGIGASILGHLTNDTLLVGGGWCTRTYNAAYAAWGQYANFEPKDTIGNEAVRARYENAHDIAMFHSPIPMQFPFPAKWPRLVIPTVVLTGLSTGSAAEDFLIMVEGQKHITTIGQTTVGSTGQPIFVDLIPDMSCRICTIKATYPDGREWVGIGIKPDIEVPITLEDYKKGYDRTFYTALKFLEKK